MCYNLPVLNHILANPASRALYLFPTKALAQDQVAELMSMGERLGHAIKTYTYDGDTASDARQAIRSAGNIVVTNPDMLHSGILPHHTKWMGLFENLMYVVVDELHIYRGVFGSHVANVLRRLQRVCRFYGSNPVFICASATIANPGEHGRRLIGREVEVVDQNGAPSGPKEVILYNPPVVNQSLGIRRSSLLETQRIAKNHRQQDPDNCLYRARVTLKSWSVPAAFIQAVGILRKRSGATAAAIFQAAPGDRTDLREGKVLGVVSTNALELGWILGASRQW